MNTSAQRPAIEALLPNVWAYRLRLETKYVLIAREVFLLGISDGSSVGARFSTEVAVFGTDAPETPHDLPEHGHVVGGLVILRYCPTDAEREEAPHSDAQIAVVQALSVARTEGNCVYLHATGNRELYVVAP